MKVSGFTFLRNARKLGYPFGESIRSILPIVDEYIVALGPSEDQTEEIIRQLGYRIHRFNSDEHYLGPELALEQMTDRKHFDIFAVPQ